MKMSNYRPLQFKSKIPVNKENLKNNRTPSKTATKSKSDVFIEETPTPNLKKKVLRLTAQPNSLLRKRILDTPTNSQPSQVQSKKSIKKLFDPNGLGDELPGGDETLVGNETYITKRQKPPSKISLLFKPKLPENQVIGANAGCDDSFETLKRREQQSSRKIVRLSEVMSIMELNENRKKLQDVTNKGNVSTKSMNFNSFNSHSLTNVTIDSHFRTHFTINNKVTSPTASLSKQSTSTTDGTSEFSFNNTNIIPDTAPAFGLVIRESAPIQLLPETVDTQVIPDSAQGESVSTDIRDSADSRGQVIRESAPIQFIPETVETQVIPDSDSIRRTSASTDLWDSVNSGVHVIRESAPIQLIPETVDTQVIPESAPVRRVSIRDSVDLSALIQRNHNDSSLFSNVTHVIPDTEEPVLNRYTRVNVHKTLYTHKKKLYVTYTNLTKMQLKILKQIVENNFKTNTVIEKMFTLKTTHLIVGNAESENGKNAKALLAVVSNCKLVRFDWAMQSSNEKKWLNETEFIPNEYKAFYEKFLKFKFDQKCIDLFSEYENIYLCQSSIKEVAREQLSELLMKLCAHVTSRPNKATLVIVNEKSNAMEFGCLNEKNVPIVSCDWIFDCVRKFEKLNVQSYTLAYT